MRFSDIHMIMIGEEGEYGRRLVRYLETHLSTAIRVYHFTTTESFLAFKERADIYLLDEAFFQRLSEERQNVLLREKQLILLTAQEEEGTFCKYHNPKELLDRLRRFSDEMEDLASSEDRREEESVEGREEGRETARTRLTMIYGEAKIRAGQQEAGGRGAAVLFLVTCLCIPVHNYLKLKEEGERHRKEAEKDFPVIVHLLTLYMGAGLSFLSAVRRIGFHYQEQKEADAKQKKYAFERVLLMEQQMNNGMSQKEACQNWGMQFHSEAYQKLALILVQSFTKGSKEASTMMEAEEREAFQRRVERAKQEGEEAATRLLFPMIVLLCQVMLLVMYPALIRFQGF